MSASMCRPPTGSGSARLALQRRSDRAIERARGGIVRALAGVAERQGVRAAHPPVDPGRAEQIVEWCWANVRGSSGLHVSRAHQNRPVLIAILRRTEPERLPGHDRPAGGSRELLPIERRLLAGAAVEVAGKLPAAVAQEERREPRSSSLPDFVTTLIADDAERPDPP